MGYKFDYTRLLVSNFKECFQFYRDVMGFNATFGSEDDVYADFNTGSTTLALFKRELMSSAIGTSELPVETIGQDRVCLIFSTEDVDEASRQLGKQGIRLLAGPQDRPDWGIRVMHFRDPDGNLIELNQPIRK
jgi:catechol 2,3-dioxygenase-like lactoylglutathione lyase family enzyme